MKPVGPLSTNAITSIAGVGSPTPSAAVAVARSIAAGLVARKFLIDTATAQRILAQLGRPDAPATPAPRALARLIAETAAAAAPGATPIQAGALERAALGFARAVALTVAGQVAWSPERIGATLTTAIGHGDAVARALPKALADAPLEPLRTMLDAAAYHLDTINGPEENDA